MNPIGTTRFAPVDQTIVHWADHGHGRPVVLIHGLADSHRTWRHLVPNLSEDRYRLLLPDLPGHGLSSRPTADYSLDWHAAILGQWVDSLGIDTFDVVGHSFGGGVAQALLLTHADRIQRVALVAPGGLGREVAWGVRLLTLPGAAAITQPFLGIGTRISMRLTDPKTFIQSERNELAWMNTRPGTARALALTARGIANLRGQRRHFLDQAGTLSRIPPIALYWGSRDPIIPVKHGATTQRILRDSRLTVFRGCGHFPHLQMPDDFADALSLFLADATLRPTRIVVPRALPRRNPWWKRFASAVARLARCAVPGRKAA